MLGHLKGDKLVEEDKVGARAGTSIIEHLLYARPGEGQLVWDLSLALQSQVRRSLSCTIL